MFFDEMGIAWTYNREGVTRDGQRVLLDFWLPDYGCFWDVQASWTNNEDCFAS